MMQATLSDREVLLEMCRACLRELACRLSLSPDLVIRELQTDSTTTSQPHDAPIDMSSIDPKAVSILRRSEYLGLAHVQCTDWRASSKKHGGYSILEAATNQVLWIEIRLSDDASGALFSNATVIGTLLHEVAHCLTPGRLVLGRSEEPTHKSQRGKWYEHVHHNEFYEHFGTVLAEAEKSGILVLPPTAHKFCRRSLQRFDKIEQKDGSNTQYILGRSPIFGSTVEEARRALVLYASQGLSAWDPALATPESTATTLSETTTTTTTTTTAAAAAATTKRPRRVTLCAKGANKVVMLPDLTTATLSQSAIAKFRLKKPPKSFELTNGKAVSDEELASLQDGVRLIVIV
jgi:hypothetical protein